MAYLAVDDDAHVVALPGVGLGLCRPHHGAAILVLVGRGVVDLVPLDRPNVATAEQMDLLTQRDREDGAPGPRERRDRRPGIAGHVIGEALRVGATVLFDEAAERVDLAAYGRCGIVVAGLESSSTNRHRYQGFTEELARHGVTDVVVEVGNYNRDDAEAAARRMFSGPDRPEALFVANDHMAVAVMDVARYQFRLSIPHDLSIVGYEDVGPARWASYGITSMSQPVSKMVEATVDILMDQIASGEIEADHRILSGNLVVRDFALAQGRHHQAGWRPHLPTQEQLTQIHRWDVRDGRVPRQSPPFLQVVPERAAGIVAAISVALAEFERDERSRRPAAPSAATCAPSRGQTYT